MMFSAFKKLALLVLALSILSPAYATEPAIKNEQAASPAQPDEEREKVFNAESFTLDNGMEVVIVPNSRAPVVTHMVWYKFGAADEPMGKSGIAHFLEHLMFKGSAQVGGRDLQPGEFSEIVRSMGGNDNAFTAQDYISYFQSVPAEHLETVMRMEAGRMNGLNPPENEVLSERKVIIEERKQRTDNDPRGQFGEQLAAAAFVNHPYGIPVIGWKHEAEALSYADAKAFYDRWYAPNNAILVVSGDVSPAKVFELAIEIYGQLPREDVPERARTRSPVLNSKTSVTLEHPAIHEPVVQTLFRVPSSHQSKDDALALQVLEEIMGGGPTSRLYKSLVVKQKIASSAGMSYHPSAWDDSSLWIYASPLPGQTLEMVQNALMGELRRLIKDGIDEDELNDAKSRMQDEAIYARDSLTGPAMVIGQSLATGQSLDDVEYWPYDIAGVSAEQVIAVAQKYLNPDVPTDHPPVSGYLLPQGQGEK
ncbi:MAG: insulinase family protein [Rhodospirillales bacterium]|nr:insulinase family protein [Rhodospirillales bacterium]